MRILVVLFVLASFSSCVNAQKKALDRVLRLEAKLKAVEDANADEELAKEVVEAYSAFLEAYPESEESPEILYKSGEVLRGLNKNLKAAKQFYRVHAEYPKSPMAPIAMIQQADCFEALGQKLTAKHIYEQFLERYPNHHYEAQVQGLIKLLYFSDDELIDNFEN